MDGVDHLVAAAPWLAVAAVALLAGAALGYYAASRDLAAEREKARKEGMDIAMSAIGPRARASALERLARAER